MASRQERGIAVLEAGEADEAVKRLERAKLDALLGICETAGCRRQALLAHFGEAHPGRCGACDTCTAPAKTIDGTEAAQKLLSAIYRTGQRFGAGHVIAVLRGQRSDRIGQAGHDGLPTFGVGQDRDERFWRSVVRQLAAAGLIAVDPRAGAGLIAGPPAALGGGVGGAGARAVLRGERPLRLRLPRPAPDAKAVRASRGERPGSVPDDPLFQRLRAERARLAQAQGVPPYVVFHDTTLQAMASIRPASLEAFRSLPGVGEAKLARYGQAFLAVIAAEAR